MDTGQSRIEEIERRVTRLEKLVIDELQRIRADLADLGGEPAPAPLRTAPPPTRLAPWPAAPVEEAEPREPADYSWLAGPQGLAIAGGLVTLLGIVFVFALAVSRGWIGPAGRCALGGVVSVLLVVAAIVVRDRYGNVVAGLAAAGTGIGGAYVTLYAASRGYHLIGAGTVWIAVVVTAAAAVALALTWDSQMLAMLGLVAIVVAPPIVQGDLTGIGLAASAVAAAAALGIGAWRAWTPLGVVAYAGAAAQILVFVVDARDGGPHRGAAGALACVAFALALAAAAAYRVRTEEDDFVSTLFAGVSLPLALVSIFALVESQHGRGAAMLATAVVYAVYAEAFRRIDLTRALALTAAASALIFVALATAEFLSNGGLALAWTLEGLGATFVAVRVHERRYQVAGIAYFVAAGVHLLIFETPFTHLFAQRADPATHVGWLLVYVVALGAAAVLLHGEDLLAERFDLGVAVTAALLLLYAASLGILEASQHIGSADLHSKFQRGETLVSVLWALVALGLLAVGLSRRIPEVRYSGIGLLGLALVKLFFFDLSKLSSLTRAASFLGVGIALLVGGFLVQRLAADD